MWLEPLKKASFTPVSLPDPWGVMQRVVPLLHEQILTMSMRCHQMWMRLPGTKPTGHELAEFVACLKMLPEGERFTVFLVSSSSLPDYLTTNADSSCTQGWTAAMSLPVVNNAANDFSFGVAMYLKHDNYMQLFVSGASLSPF
jgi:hypothetical protein